MAKTSARRGKVTGPGKSGAKAARPGRQKVARPGGSRGLRHFLLFVGYATFGVLLLFEPTMAALIVVGLAPSLVALFFDHGAFRRPRLITLCCFNLAGFLPYFARLLSAHDQVGEFFSMITDIYVWAVIYGATALGAGLLWVGPFLAAIVLQALNDERIKEVEKRQLALVKEWGAEVKGPGAA